MTLSLGTLEMQWLAVTNRTLKFGPTTLLDFTHFAS